MSDRADALVIFGATGDLAKLETFPALVGLAERDVLNVPVAGVTKGGWDLEQFRDYAAASLKLNNMDPASPAAIKMLGLLRMSTGSRRRRHLPRRVRRAAWQVVDPVLGDVTPVHPYAKGSWGPEGADRLLPDRDAWRDPAG